MMAQVDCGKAGVARQILQAAGFACSQLHTSEDQSVMFIVFWAGRSVGYVIEDYFVDNLHTEARMYVCSEDTLINYTKWTSDVNMFIERLRESVG